MDRNGQLTFSDDPLLLGVNETYELIEKGEFAAAVNKVDSLMSRNPEYPGLTEAYRTAKFWSNRTGEVRRLEKGKQVADFMMTQWEVFKKYAAEKGLSGTNAFKAAMRYVFFTASENYKVAFQGQESTADNFDLLLNLGLCFLTLGEHKRTIETLEYARSSYRSSPRLLAILGEAYYHAQEIPKSLLLFREAFFLNPSEIDMNLLTCKPITDLAAIVAAKKPDAIDAREWIPVYGHTEDMFYVKRQLNSQQVETIKREIYSLEKNFQSMGPEKARGTNIVPRLVNKYLWMLDYYEFQHYDFDNIREIRSRLLQIDKGLFEEYFKRAKNPPR